MPARRKSLKVVLCATLTADGKLDAAEPLLPPVLHEGASGPPRHSWAKLFDQAAGILVDSAEAEKLPPPLAASRMVLAIEMGRSGDQAATRGQLVAALDRLRREGVAGDLLCFGGPGLFRALLDAGLAAELRLLVRPNVDGRRGAATLSGVGGEFFPASVACRLLRMETAGDECLLHYRVVRRRRTGAGVSPGKKVNRSEGGAKGN